MEKFMNWMSDVVAPKMEELTGNAWLSAMQKAIIKTLPMVLVGSLITIYNVLRNFIPALPVLTALRDYTFGLIPLLCVGTEKQQQDEADCRIYRCGVIHDSREPGDY